jgi:hypothetical protein
VINNGGIPNPYQFSNLGWKELPQMEQLNEGGIWLLRCDESSD